MQPPKRFPFCIALAVTLAVTATFTAIKTCAQASTATILAKLVFDADSKLYDAKLDEKFAEFKFALTNTWTNEITIDRVQTSCGCTVASLPSSPWHVPPGGHGDIGATVDLSGKGAGLLQKTLTVYVSASAAYVGARVLTVKVHVPEPSLPTALSAEDRKLAMEKAKADPQEIFKNPKCAACHVDAGRNKREAKLYAADCGICHDSPNRASWVPDLHALKVPTDLNYWRNIISNGKPHTLMPAFATSAGGPLDDDTIHDLAMYLDRTISKKSAGLDQ